MSVREYIGARYVPIFGRKDEESIIWDNSAPYEPLTVVLHNGNSYTSRQFVPVGIDIDNQEFWALTGNYNAQIEVYRQETARAVEVAENSEEIASEANEAVTAEISRATAKENEISESLDAETTRATAKENEISESLDAETIRATTKENEISESLDAETTRATTKENEIISIIADTSPFAPTIFPSYIGDIAIPKRYDSDPQCSCCCVDDSGYLYAFCPDNWNGNGTMYVYQLESGTLIRKRENLPIGHANSCAFIPETGKIILNCHTTRSAGQPVISYNMLIFDKGGASHVIRTLPVSYYGISYDAIANKLYAMTSEANASTAELFELDKTTLNSLGKICTLDYSNIVNYQHKVVLQDIAIRNGNVFVLFTDGTVAFDNLANSENGELAIENTAMFKPENNLFYMGETEGIEFGQNGILYGTCNFYLNGICAGFIVAWNMREIQNTEPFINVTLHGSVDLVNSEKLFLDNAYMIRSIEMLEIMKGYGIATLRVNSDFTEPGDTYPSRISKTCSLAIGSGIHFKCFNLQVVGGNFFLRNTGTFETTSPNSAIHTYSRAVNLSVDNRGTIVKNSNLWIDPDYTKNAITFGLLNNDPNINIDGTAVTTQNSIWVGTHKIGPAS